MSLAADSLAIRFWGVRGSIPTPDSDKLRFGGNTPCISVQHGAEPAIIVDAGTGILSFAAESQGIEEWALNATILFSHFHWDHIQGFPFLPPLYSEQNRFKLYSTFEPSFLEGTLKGQMQEPYFPIPYSAIRAGIQYGKIAESGIEIGSLKVRPIPLNHPGGCSGYRMDSPAGSIVYVSDHEHGVEEIDSQIVEICQGADLLIYDAHFTPEEYLRFRGWGHSTWLEGTNLAKQAGARCLRLFHHSPTRTDGELDLLLEEARGSFAETWAAQENEAVLLSRTRIHEDEPSVRC